MNTCFVLSFHFPNLSTSICRASQFHPNPCPSSLSLSLMGFPCICNSFILPKPLAQLIRFICQVRYATALVLSSFGLQPPPEVFLIDHDNHHLSIATTTSTINTPVDVKAELPVMEFSTFIRRFQGRCAKTPTPRSCVVCLSWLEARDEVRELGNCEHAFHRYCIDRWVDAGNVTCPLCRSHVLPPRERRKAGWLPRLRLWQ